MSTDVFISYNIDSSASIVRKIADSLENAGVKCWYSGRDCTGAFASVIGKEILTCSVFIVVLNKRSSESPHVLNELNMVTNRLRDENVLIIPFRVSDETISVESQYYIGRMNIVYAVGNSFEEGLSALLEQVTSFVFQKRKLSEVHRRGKEYNLVNSLPAPREIFFGREDVFAEIDDVFTKERIVFLEGMGGIGKTEIAKQYAAKRREVFDKIIFLNCASGIKDAICDPFLLQIENYFPLPNETYDQCFQNKLSALKSASNNKTIIIADNFDSTIDPDIDAFVAGEYKIIFTTRTHHNFGKTISVKELGNVDILLQVFQANYGMQLEKDDVPYVKKLIEKIGCHTYATELLAKQMKVSFISAKELYNLFINREAENKLNEAVDENSSGKNAIEYIHTIFGIGKLPDEEKMILRCLSLFNGQRVPADVFKKWTDISSFASVNSLINKSLIRRESGRFLLLHPLIRETVIDVLHPNAENCGEMIERIGDTAFSAWFTPIEENIRLRECIPAVLDSIMPFCMKKIECCEAMTSYLWQVAQFEKSIKYTRYLYEESVKTNGENHFVTGFLAKSVGGAYFNSHRFEESAPWFKKALQIMQNTVKEPNEDLAMAYEKVARVYTWDFCRDMALAEQNFVKALEVRMELKKIMLAGGKTKMFHSRENPDIALIYERIGENYFEWGRMKQIEGNYALALQYVQKSIEIGYPHHRDREDDLAYNYYDSGVCYYYLGVESESSTKNDFSREYFLLAENCLKKALSINMRMRGVYAFDVLDNIELLADTYAALKNFNEARELYRSVVIEVERMGDSREEIKKIQTRISEKLKKYSENVVVCI